MTHRANVRREEAQFRREEAQFNRQQEEQRMQARREAYAELLNTAIQLRAEIEITEQRHWKDMNVRLATIQRHAVSAGPHAELVGLLSPETAGAARALASAAVELAAATAKHTEMGDEGGQITPSVNFTEFDGCFIVFSEAAARGLRA